MSKALYFAVALCSSLCISPLLAAAPANDAASQTGIVNRIHVGGDGGWDYLAIDTPRHRLYVSHGDRVVVLDLVTGRAVGVIADTAGVHGIAVAPALNMGFTSNGASNTVTVFDLASLKTLGTITGTGTNPDAILYDDSSRSVFTFNGKGHSASVIDPVKRTVTNTIALPGKPEFAQADGAGHIYVNIEDRSELVEIDARQRTVTRSWPLAPCQSPSGLALDRKHHRLFSVCDNETLVVSDAIAGKVVASIPIGRGPDAVVFDADSRTAYSSNGGSGTLSVIHQDDADHYRVTDTIPTQSGARTEALDPTTHRMYLSVAQRSAKTDDQGHHALVPDTFEVLVVGLH